MVQYLLGVSGRGTRVRDPLRWLGLLVLCCGYRHSICTISVHTRTRKPLPMVLEGHGWQENSRHGLSMARHEACLGGCHLDRRGRGYPYCVLLLVCRKWFATAPVHCCCVVQCSYWLLLMVVLPSLRCILVDCVCKRNANSNGLRKLKKYDHSYYIIRPSIV
jgi:hypothetical protein